MEVTRFMRFLMCLAFPYTRFMHAISTTLTSIIERSLYVRMFLCSKDFFGDTFSVSFIILVICNIVFIVSFKASEVLNSTKNHFDGAKRKVPVDSIAE